VYAQLIFGGYDTSRIQTNSASFSLAPDQDRDIVVAVQQIIHIGTSENNLLSSPIYAFIDSTDPLIWLPSSACAAFETAFNLTPDPETNLYILTEDQHSAQLAANRSVIFELADEESGGQAVSIMLPYSAFDLVVDYPIVSTPKYYFPLRKAENESQYTLGRTFLQEA